MRQPPVIVSIGGSDSGGGAGVQRDVRTAEAMGVFATTVITAVTAQNASGVHAVEVLSGTLVAAQLQAVTSGFALAAVKTGMLGSAEIVELTAGLASLGRLPNLVVDPVLVSSSGRALLADDAIESYVRQLLPHARVVTPNWDEAERLTGVAVTSMDSAERAARELLAIGVEVAVVTGSGTAPDLFVNADGSRVIATRHVDTMNTHGTGCAFSSGIACGLARRLDTWEAVIAAQQHVQDSLVGSVDWTWRGPHGPFGSSAASVRSR